MSPDKLSSNSYKQLAQEQRLLQMPSEWAMARLQQMFEGLGEVTSLAHLKAGVHLCSMMLEEATVAAYQDGFLLSALISLVSIMPGLLRTPTPKAFGKRAQHRA